MPSKKIAVAACLFVSAAALANNKTYTVHKGDTLESIAKRLKVTPASLASENHLNKQHLKPGTVLTLPGTSSAQSGATYTVKSGDNDWVIAHHLGISLAVLKGLNPKTDWQHLQIGSNLHIPSSCKAAVAIPKLNSRYAVVTGDFASIRRGPGVNEEKITLVDKGTKVVVLDHDSGWYKLKFPKGTVGWMRGDLLKAVSAPKEVVAAVRRSHQKRQVIAAKPKPVQRPAAVASKPHQEATGDRVAAYEPEKVTVEDPTVEAVLKKAYALRGTPYHYGGLSSRGLDCSGFTSTVFKANGIKLPRTSRSQATVGFAVSRANLTPGDLVFFRHSRSSRISHVGIYVGDGKFIHASSGHGRVRVDNLNGHYSNVMATARRVLKRGLVAQANSKQSAATEIPWTAGVTAKRSVIEADSSKN